MKTLTALLVGTGIAVAPTVAFAFQPAAEAPASASAVRRGTLVFTSDGKRVGRIEMIRSEGGVPSSAGVIYNGRMIYLPVANLTPNDRGLVGSFDAKALRKM